jgi:hypothetical protein
MLFRLVTLLLTVTLLGACATVPNKSIENLQGEIPEGSGLVVAETLNNGTRIVGRINYWTEIVLWRQNYEGEDDTFSIGSLSYSLSTQAYMGVVPAGTYRIGLLYAFLQLGDMSVSGRAIVPPAMGTFEVKAGQVTNLGTILYQPFQDRSWIEDEYPDYAMTRIANEKLWSAAGLANPEVAAKIDASAPILGWNPDRFDAERDMAAQLMKAAALPTNMHALSDGGFLLTGLYGGLYSFRDGDWRNHSMRSRYKVTDAVELPDGRLLVGSELGRLSVSGPLGEEPRDVPIAQGLKHVIDIDLSSGGQAYVMTFADDEYQIRQYVADTESLSLLKSLPKGSEGLFGMSSAVLVGTTDGVAVFMDKIVHRYDEVTKQWSSAEADEFITLYRQLDGYISGIPHSSWSGAKPLLYSADDGNTWTALQEKSSIFGASRSPTYRFGDGELIRTGEDVDINFFKKSIAKNEVPVLSTTDDGVNWTPVGTVRRGCITIVVEASTDELLHILCTDGGTLSSQDRGRTWRQSLEPRIPDFDDFPGVLKLRYTRD